MGLQSSDTGYRCRVVTDSLPSFCRVKMLRFISVLVLFLTIGVGNVWATPTVLFHETFGNNSGSARAWNNDYKVQSGVSTVYSGASYIISNFKQSKNTVGSTASGLLLTTTGTDAVFEVGPLNVSSYESLAVSFQYKAGSIKETYDRKLYYKTSDSGSYTSVSVSGTKATSFNTQTASLPAAASGISTLYLKVICQNSKGQDVLDEFELTGTASTPSCSAPTSPSISGTTAYTAGQTISLTASATGTTNGTTTYQWYKGDPDNGGTSQGAASTSGATFTKANCVVGDAATYYCVISNGTGCTAKASKTITVSAPSYTVGWSITSSGGTLSSTSGTSTTVTPTSGWRYADPAYTVLTGTSSVSQSNNTFTATPSANSTIRINMEEIPVHTITWSANGVTSTTNVTDGNALVLPSNPTSCNTTTYGTFIGWYTTAAGSETTPSNAVSGTKAVASHIPTGDETYYAVWANGPATGDFALVTNANQLSAGDVVTIASVAGNSQSGKVIKAYNSGNNWPTADVTTSATGKIATSTTNMQTFTLAAGTVDDTWAFSDGTGYIYAANTKSGTSNYMKRQTTLDAAGSFTIGIDGSTSKASVVSHGDVNSRNTIRFNGSNNPPIFSCYASGGQSDIYLYKQESGATAFISTCCTKHDITISGGITNGTVTSNLAKACEGTSVTLTATGTENEGRFKNWSITGLDSYSATTNPLTFDMPDNDVTVSATFDALYAITKSETGGTITLGADYAAEGDAVTISASANQDYENPVLKVYKTGDESTEITVSAGSFTMPGYAVTAKVTCTPSKTPLPAPTMGANTNLTYNGVQLNWTNVANNSGYVLTVMQGEDVVEGYNAKAIDQNATSTVITGLEHLTAYTYTLYAKGDGVTYVVVNTAANGSFTTTDYPTVKIYYSENEVMRVAAGESQKILTDFTLPSTANTSCPQKTLVGWTTEANAEYSHASTAPTPLYAPGATIQITEETTLYAVYAKVTAASTSWSRVTAISTLTDGGTFIMGYEDEAKSGEIIPLRSADCNATTSANGYFNTGTSNTSSGNGTIDMSSVSSTSDYEVYISSPTDGKINIQMGTSTGNYYGATSGGATSNKGRLYTSGNSTETNIIPEFSNEGNNHFKLKTAVSGEYKYLKYNTGSPRFAFYNSAGEKVVFYKKNVTPASTTNYATQCMSQVAKPSISGVTDGETYEENKTVTITCGTSDATIYYSIDGNDPTTEYTEPFTLSDNDEYTIRAYATKTGMIDSDEADEVTVTIDKPFTTIASFIAAAPTNKKLVLTGAKVLGVTSNYIYIQDATAGIQLNKSSHGISWASGKTLSGYVIGTYSNNSSSAYMPRLTFTDGSTMSVTEDAPALPAATVITAGSEANICKLVKLENVKFQSTSLSSNTVYVQKNDLDIDTVYNTFGVLNQTLPNSATLCDVTGVLIKYSGKYEIAPVSVNGISTNGALAILPKLSTTGSTDSESPTAVAEGKVITITPAAGMTSTYKDGDEEAADLTSATDVTIDEDKAIVVTANAYYYTENSATYYYHADASLTERTISKAAMSNGSVTIKNGEDEVSSALAGTPITLYPHPTFTTTQHYHLTGISVVDADEEPVSLTTVVENEEYTFTMPAKTVTVSATFAEDSKYAITFDGNENTGGTAPSAISNKYAGTEITLPACNYKKSGYSFTNWSVAETESGDAVAVANNKFTMPAAAVTIKAQWEPLPVWATTYTSNITTTAESLVEAEDGEEYDAWKVNSGSYITLDIPKGTTAIHMHMVAWNKEAANATISGACFTSNKVVALTADAGISGNSPFSLDDNEGSDYYFSFTPDNAITSNTTIRIDAAYNKRLVVFGVNAIYPEITLSPASYNFENVRAGQNKTQEFTITTNANVTGALSASIIDDENGKYSVSDIENGKVTVTFAPGEAASGTFEAKLKVEATNASVTANLTGTAIAAAAPEIVVNKNAIAFGQVDPNASVSEAIAVQLLHIDGAVSAALSGDDAAKFSLSTTSLSANGNLVITPNTTEIGVFSATLTLSATDAEDVVIPLSITVANKWAVTYTSNVTVSANDTKKVKVGSDATEYNASKTNSGATATIHLPMGTKKVHLHMVAWKDEGGTVTVSGACFNSNKNITVPANDVVSGTASTYTFTDKLALSYYHEIAIDNEIGANGVDVSVSKSGNRIVLFGVNEEGGIHTLPADETNASTLPEEINLLIGDDKTLNVNSDKTLHDVTIQSTSGAMGVDGTSGQLTGNGTLTVTGDLYLEIQLRSDEMDAEASRKWYCISAPFDVDINNGFYWGDGTHMVHNVDFQIFEWDGDRRATGASGWRRTGGTMKAGVAYFIGFDDARANQNTIKLKAKNNTISNVGAINAPAHSGSAEAETYGNWNGLGNPNFHHIALNKNVQAFDYNEQSYNPYTTGDYNFVVGTPFFIQYAGNIGIEAADNANYRAPKREGENYSYCVRIGKADASHADNQIFVRASETASAEFDDERDMITMNGTTSNYGALIWTKNYGGKRLAIEEAPLVNNKASYELGIFAPTAGTYSISVAAPQENAELYLTKNGHIIWNLTMSPCELELTQGQNDEYGLMLRANVPSVSTDVDNGEWTNGEWTNVQKVIIDEKVFILRGGKMYGVTGKEVR